MGNDNIMVMNNINLDVEGERKTLMTKSNQKATEIEDIITNTSPDDETTRNGGKWRR